MWRLMRGVAVLSLGIAGQCTADDAAAVPELQQIVEQSADQFVKAFGEQNAAAIADLFTEEAEYVDASGTIFHGQSAIGAEFAAAFVAHPPGTISVELLSIRPIAQSVVVEEGISSFVPEGGGPTSRTHYTATHVKQADGDWLIASLRELHAGAMTAHDRLQALSWLVGQWHEDVGGNVIATEWTWAEEGNFLISQFSIRQSSDVAWTGTHRIGWDAERKQFRSWIFESQGGAMEGWWRRGDDGSWSVSLSGVDAEGIRRSSTLTYERDGQNAIVVTQTQRVVGGESLPGSVHRAVRQPPAVEVSTSQR